MRTAETVLGVIRERGRRGLPLGDIYRQLFNPDLYLKAYGRLYRNDGAMTPGATAETVDGMSLEKINTIIEALRSERYWWTPVRRTYIPKKNGSKKLRPLGLPTWSDKLLQEVIRLILEAYYEPQFSSHSHGYRPGLGCHTALAEVTKWKGVKWYVEGDISHCFDSFDHSVMLSILGEKLYDNRLLWLISGLLKAGYLEDWRYHTTLSGVPQGSVVSPILSNIYLAKLDQFVETVLLPRYNRGERRRENPPYKTLINAARRRGEASRRDQAKASLKRALRQQAQQMPSRDPQDPDFRRLRYVRLADDFLLGFSGPRAEAGEIKSLLGEFLREQLKLELSEQKTLITNARSESARFLNYEIVTLDADDKRHKYQRRINGNTGLKVPEDVIKAKCSRYMRHGRPIHLATRTHDTDYSIVTQYQAEYRGFVQYYLLAFNVSRLWSLHRVMQLSLVMTLANKYKTSINQIFRKYKTVVATPHGSLKVLEVTVNRGIDKKPLVARFGGIELRHKKRAILNDRPPEVYSGRSEVVQRLLGEECELCESEETCEVHHIRKLADLNKPGQKEKPDWVKRMAARHRKTLVVCRRCHEAIHYGKPNGGKFKI
ncbi:MAG: maturase [Acidobacteria bacterium]|nr:maturase [Acidobacteriota bacterium]